MIGILLVNKPIGITSSNVVVKIKKIVGEKRVGHLGTLDPMASGVLPICIGKATRLFDLFLNKTKQYIAQFKFGMQTDTLDITGKIEIENGKIPNINDIQDALKSFIGKINQMPPHFSAKKVDGVRAYKLARKGEDFDLKPKEVEIFGYKLLKQISNDTFQFSIDCSSGTYIRSLARDLGERLGTCAIMSNLVRTRCGSFTLDNCVEFENLDLKTICAQMLSLDDVLKDIKVLDLSDEQFKKITNGVAIFTKHIEKIICVKYKNQVAGLAENIDGVLKMSVNLKE